MKKIILKLMFAMIIALGIATKTQGQWITTGPALNVFAQPDNTVPIANWTRSIGIGYFNTAGTYPLSFLHINTRGMVLPGNLSITSFGEVFRTDCPALNSTNYPANAWRMFTDSIEKGGLFNYYSATNPYDFTIQSSYTNARLLFNAGGAKPHMQILGSNGFVGIGNYNFFMPDNKLDVDSGDIDVNQPVNCYMIGDSAVLHYRGDATYTSPSVTNIFVGVGAGQHNTTGIENTCVGYQAGYSNAIEPDETFIGYKAGYNTHSGIGNTFVGSEAGFINNTGVGNVFVGVKAGFSNVRTTGTEGSYNTIVGNLAGEKNTTGMFNCFYGKHAGWDNQSGVGNVYVGDHCGTNSVSTFHNTFIGLVSGEFNTGNENTMCGFNSGHNNHGNRNILFGWNAGLNNTGDTNVIIGPSAGVFNKGNLNIITGKWAGLNNTGDTNVMSGLASGFYNKGNLNCFYGAASGFANYGDSNTYIGYRAHVAATGFHNTTALGANTEVTANNTMILGDNTINVGIGLSGDPFAPQSKLEINYSVPNDFTAPNIYGGTGFSGLQFRDLTADSHPIPYNPGKGVLSVDKFGVVIYVPDFKDIGFGLPCPAVGTDPLWEMPSDWRVGLNGNKLVFSDGPNYNSNSNHIGIGYDCNEDLLGKLSVREKDINTALNLSLAGYFISIADSTKAIGVCGMAIDNIDGIVSYGVAGFAAKAETNIGVVGMASGDTVGTYNIGVAGIAFGDSSNNIYNIGVYGQSFPLDDATAINKNWAGYFNGALYASSSWLTSDSIFKTNVTPITNSLEKIKELKPVSFLFNRDMGNGLGVSLPDREQYGFLAQNVSTVFLELVAEVTKPPQYDGFGIETHPAFSFKALNYNAFIGILTQGVKELDSMNTVLTHKMDSTNTALTHKLDSINTVLLHKNDSLRNVLNLLNNRLDQIENRLEDCCKASSGGGPGHSMMTNPSGANTAEIELENIQSIVLDQNVPNPFAESTVITYFIPDNINYSQIVFTDNYGRIMKTVDIKISGNGMIKVYAANLSSGTYTYSLMVDGKVVETKKMMCVK